MRRLAILLLLVSAACTPAATTTPTAGSALLAPDFTAMSLMDDTYTLSELRGRCVLLNFCATWCVPCAAEMPALQQLADTYADEVVLLVINLREDAGAVAPFVAEHRLRFPILISPDDATLLNYQVVGLPQTLLISPPARLSTANSVQSISLRSVGNSKRISNPSVKAQTRDF